MRVLTLNPNPTDNEGANGGPLQHPPRRHVGDRHAAVRVPHSPQRRQQPLEPGPVPIGAQHGRVLLLAGRVKPHPVATTSQLLVACWKPLTPVPDPVAIRAQHRGILLLAGRVQAHPAASSMPDDGAAAPATSALEPLPAQCQCTIRAAAGVLTQSTHPGTCMLAFKIPHSPLKTTRYSCWDPDIC